MFELYYIQRFIQRSPNIDCSPELKNSIERFLMCDYVRAAGFDFGRIPRSFKILSEIDLTLYTHTTTIDGKEITLYAVTNEVGYEKFKVGIERLLSNEYNVSKEPTYIRDVVSNPDKFKTIAWMDVYPVVKEDFVPVFFTHLRHIAIRTLLELYRKRYQRSPIRVFDKVVCFRKDEVAKVSSINPDDSVTIRYPYGKTTKNHEEDLWVLEDLKLLPKSIQDLFNIN